MAQVRHARLKQQIIDTCLKLNELGVNQGTSGNVSVRQDDYLLITPSGVRYDKMRPADIVHLYWDGSYEGPRLPSSEWRFHYDIMRARPDAGAIIHTHSVNCTALACNGKGIPAFHYMIGVAGGDSIRCAPYATYGTQALSDNALAALKDRRACLLSNHGMICFSDDLQKALGLAVEVETLARQYILALEIGRPKLLTKAEMKKVVSQFQSYGKAPEDIPKGAVQAFEAPPRRDTRRKRAPATKARPATRRRTRATT